MTGVFQCDCRGVGSDWRVCELRQIASSLLGGVELIAEPAGMAADFEALMQKAMGRGVAAATLRVWAPQEGQVLFVRQVAPTVEDLTASRQVVNPLTGGYPTGSWEEITAIASRSGCRPSRWAPSSTRQAEATRSATG